MRGARKHGQAAAETASAPQAASAWRDWPGGRQAGIAFALALASAALYTLAMPGPPEGFDYLGQWRLLPFCLLPLILAARLRPRWAALSGFCFGILTYPGQLHWIVVVLGRYGGLPDWTSFGALALLAAYMALYSAAFCLLLAWMLDSRTRHGATARAIIAVWAPPVVWTGLDALRGVLLTGFPWMDLGYGLFRRPTLLTPADLGGHHLLTFTLVLVNAVAALLVFSLVKDRPASLRQRPASLSGAGPALAAVCCFLAALAGYAALRGAATREEIAEAPRLKVGVAQGNIEQDLKWTEGMMRETVARYLALSEKIAEAGLDLVVWPETALPFYPQDNPLGGEVAAFAAKHPKSPKLLVGAPLYRVEETAAGRETRHFNGALLLGRGEDGRGRVEGLYCKQHLVPFGEYVPMRRLLFFLGPVATIGDFSPGAASGPIPDAPGERNRAGVLICYESIFPAVARRAVAQGADFLANLTNDAWYGRSAAPVQSLAMATLRAVENRRALVRSANTGISGFVDPLGRISAETRLFTEDAVAEAIPLLRSKTFFTRMGHGFGFLCAFLILPLIAPALLARIERRRHGRAAPEA